MFLCGVRFEIIKFWTSSVPFVFIQTDILFKYCGFTVYLVVESFIGITFKSLEISQCYTRFSFLSYSLNTKSVKRNQVRTNVDFSTTKRSRTVLYLNNENIFNIISGIVKGSGFKAGTKTFLQSYRASSHSLTFPRGIGKPDFLNWQYLSVFLWVSAGVFLCCPLWK